MKTAKNIAALIFTGLLFTFILTSALYADVPKKLSYSGSLLDSAGKPITGTKTIVFNISCGSTTSGNITKTNVSVSSGAFSTELDLSALTHLDFNNECTVSVTVDGTSLGSHTIAASPYCLNTDKLDGKDSTEFITLDYGRSGAASMLYEGTTALSSKYLGISAKAADADKLDGNDSTYFQKAITGVDCSGQVMVGLNTDGSFKCELDDAGSGGGGGTITSVTAGGGLTGGGSAGGVTLNVGAGTGISVGNDTVGITDSGVSTTQLADSAVTSGKIKDYEIADADISTNASIAQSKILNLTTDLAGKASASHNHDSVYMNDEGGEVNSSTDFNFTTSTKITNLDADKLDGNDSSYFAVGTHNHDSSYGALSHNHDTTYLKKSGDTMTGALQTPKLEIDNTLTYLDKDTGGNLTLTDAVSGTKKLSDLVNTSVSWSSITGIPSEFSDNTDNDTTYSAGSGLTLSLGQFSVNFDGTGSATTASKSDHTHDYSLTYVNEGQANSITSSMITDGTITYSDVDTNSVQRRVSGVCASGSAIRSINADGTVASCETDEVGIPSCSSCDSSFVNTSGDTMTGRLSATYYSNDAISGYSGSGFSGVSGFNNSSGSGVYGSSSSGYGVYGMSTSNDGVKGEITNSSKSAVAGINSGSGYGVYAQSAGTYAIYSTKRILATGYDVASSREYKTEINPFTQNEYKQALVKLINTDVVHFRYKDDTQEKHIGLIAEDAPEEMVTENRKAVRISDSIAILLAAIKAQQTEIEELKTEIRMLKNSNK